MKKYEVPEMNISKFEVENILTESSGATVASALVEKGYSNSAIVYTKASDWNNIF